jgi:hypothetical protein
MVAHPQADIETTLRCWIEVGPGPRPFVTITAARRRNGDAYRSMRFPCSTTIVPIADAFSRPACFQRRGARNRP